MMAKPPAGDRWTRARLIPVSGIGSSKEAETRAASAVLAVISVVRELSLELFSPMGAPRAGKATVETFTEPQFEYNGKRVRPDGIVRISYGKAGLYNGFCEEGIRLYSSRAR